MKRVHGNVTAGCFALSAFLVALTAGLSAGNPLNTILLRALLAMVLCYPLGLVAGRLCGWVVQQHAEGRSGENASAEGSDGRVMDVQRERADPQAEITINRGGGAGGVPEEEEALAVPR